MNINSKYNLFDEAAQTALLREGNISAFEAIYHHYWPQLYGYVYNRLQSREIAEEIIQEVFFSLWAKRAALELSNSLSAYLFTAVKYQVFNYIRSDKVRKTYARFFAQDREKMTDNSNEEHIAVTDLKDTIEKEISRLPEKCREVFRMSRQEHLSVHDIAHALNISRKTVENHLTKALRQLRMVIKPVR